MSTHPSFVALKDRLRAILDARRHQQESLMLPFGGIVACRRRQRIRRVSFYEPGLILVAGGVKTVHFPDRPIRCTAGEMLAIPALSHFDMINLPENSQEPYLALFLGFSGRLIQRLRLNYGALLENGRSAETVGFHIGANALLYDAVLHYLNIVDRPGVAPELLEHRLLDLLICLVTHTPGLHLRLSLSESWRERICAILMTEPGRNWHVADICARLAVSESTLRRRLNGEGADFQSILKNLRLSLALTQVQMTRQPIYEVALNCGYNSASQFTRRFRERFGVTPTALRVSHGAIGQQASLLKNAKALTESG